MNITIVTTARTDEEGRALLKHLGMPFRLAGSTQGVLMAKLVDMIPRKLQVQGAAPQPVSALRPGPRAICASSTCAASASGTWR